MAASFRGAYSKFLEKLIADEIRKGQQQGEFDPSADASQVAAMLVGALDGIFLHAWLDPGIDPVSIGDQFAIILLQKLLADWRKVAESLQSGNSA